MYLRVSKQRLKDGSLIEHYQLAESAWDRHRKLSESGCTTVLVRPKLLSKGGAMPINSKLFAISACVLVASCSFETDRAESGLTGDPTLPSCGFDVVEPPAAPTIDACIDGEVVLAPTTLTRGHGSPVAEEISFSIGPPPPTELPEAALLGSGSLCLLVRNGSGASGTRVASGEIALDGEVAAGPAQLNPTTPTFEAQVRTTTGEHTLSVLLRSRPGSSITVEGRFALDPTASPFMPAAGDHGRLSVFDLADSPDPFSPNGDGVRDTAELRALVQIDALPGAPSSTHEFFLRSRLELAGGTTCDAVTTLEAEFPVVAPGTQAIAHVWDGSTSSTSTVPDGSYFYRIDVQLVRRQRTSGREQIVDTARTPIQVITVDTAPPVVALLQPGNPETFGSDGIVLPSEASLDVDVSGVTRDDDHVETAFLEINGVARPLPAGGYFLERSRLRAGSSGAFTENTIRATATDRAGNSASSTLLVRVANRIVSGQLGVRFQREAREQQVADVLAEFGASARWIETEPRFYILQLPPGADAAVVAADLRTRTGIVDYAFVDVPRIPAQLPNDRLFGGFRECAGEFSLRYCTWYLDNDPSLFMSQFVPCATDSDCPVSGQSCRNCGSYDCCTCSSDSQCSGSETCLSSSEFRGDGDPRCGIQNVADADIAWADSIAEIRAIEAGPETVLFAVHEAGGSFDVTHPDIRSVVFTNELECCGNPICSETDGLPNCVPGAAHTEPGGPTDQCPGRCGDDDRDGFADFLDLEVAGLVERLCVNTHDEDGDGSAGNTDPACDPVRPTDPSCDCFVAPTHPNFPGEEVLAALDDDENGFIDDVHGFDFGAAESDGELAGTTVVGEVRRLSSHALRVASVISATMDNAINLPATHPNAELLIIGAGRGISGSPPGLMGRSHGDIHPIAV